MTTIRQKLEAHEDVTVQQLEDDWVRLPATELEELCQLAGVRLFAREDQPGYADIQYNDFQALLIAAHAALHPPKVEAEKEDPKLDQAKLQAMNFATAIIQQKIQSGSGFEALTIGDADVVSQAQAIWEFLRG